MRRIDAIDEALKAAEHCTFAESNKPSLLICLRLFDLQEHLETFLECEMVAGQWRAATSSSA